MARPIDDQLVRFNDTIIFDSQLRSRVTVTIHRRSNRSIAYRDRPRYLFPLFDTPSRATFPLPNSCRYRRGGMTSVRPSRFQERGDNNRAARREMINRASTLQIESNNTRRVYCVIRRTCARTIRKLICELSSRKYT